MRPCSVRVGEARAIEELSASGASTGLVLGRWNQAIDKAAKNQDPETAERLIMQIREAGLTPDTVSYNSVMHACAREGDPRRMEHWHLEMRREDIEANTITHNIMIEAYAKHGDAAGAGDASHRMLDDGVEAEVPQNRGEAQ